MITIRSILSTLALTTFALAPLAAMQQDVFPDEQGADNAVMSTSSTLLRLQELNNNPKEFVKSLEFLTSKCRLTEDLGLLVKNLSSANLSQIMDSNGRTPLHWAVTVIENVGFVDTKVVEVLLNAVKDVYAFAAIRDKAGNTALDEASFSNNVMAIELIIKALGQRACEFICTTSERGWSIVHNAALWGRRDILELCFATASTSEQIENLIYLEDDEHDTPFSLAQRSARELIQEYIDKLDQ